MKSIWKVLVPLTLLFVTSVAFSWQAPTPSASTMPTSYQNFILGSSIDDIIAAGLIRLDLCTGKPKGNVKQDCKTFDRIKAGESVGVQIENSTTARVALDFDHKKLVHVTVNPSVSSSFQVQIALLTQKFGPPTRTETRMEANALGGSWDCGDATWERFDGATIAVHEFIEMLPISGPTRAVMVVFTSKEQVEKERAEFAAKQPKY